MKTFSLVLICFAILFADAQAQVRSQEESGALNERKQRLQNDFINPQATSVKIPSFTGERYEAMVPDTIDIAQRCKLAIRGLMGPLDPNDGYALYWVVNYGNSPPVMKKESYLHLRAKYMEALPLLRLATGSDLNNHVDQVWANDLMKMIGPDGLIYAVSKVNGQRLSLEGCGISRLMGMIMIYYQRDHDPRWKKIMEKLILRLSDLAVDKGDWAYFSKTRYNLGEQVDPNAPMPLGVAATNEFSGRIVQQLGQYYELTEFEPAKKLGDKLINFILNHAQYFGPNGEWLTDKRDTSNTSFRWRGEDVHMGNHSHTLLFMTDYALGTQNKSLLNYLKKSFDYGIRLNSTVPGQCETATRIGFFVEFMNPYYPTAEHCGVADMIAIALKLSQAGVDDYWDQVDGWIRNHFIENQVSSAHWIERLDNPVWPRTASPDETDINVAERNVGSFFSWATANDGCPHGSGHMHCCMGNGSRTLYYIWENILDYDPNDGELRINLLMNRASRWADVDSFIPYVGQVNVKVKQSLKKLSLRVPAWIPDGDARLKCTVNGQSRAIAWQGRYVNVGQVQAGNAVSVMFPIREQKITRRVYGAPVETLLGGVVYDYLIFRGNEVVAISPQGKHYPYYQREYYRQNEPHWCKVERFVSNEHISW